MSDALKPLLLSLSQGGAIEADRLEAAIGVLLSGEASQAQTGALLMGLSRSGLSGPMVAAGARAMRAVMTPVDAGSGLIDVCGTGGDGAHSLNISTAVSFVLAGAGLMVAKHGNRAMSSRSGAADVLEALGVNLAISPDLAARAIAEVGVGFLFAQNHHPAMRHVGPARKELGFRTLFNLLGPLTNPAGVSRQLVGVYAPEALPLMAEALAILGVEAAWVVHGEGGIDELSLQGPTEVWAVSGKQIERFSIIPEEAGLARSPLSSLKGGDAHHNAAAMMALFDGETGPYHDAVVLNAAAALVVSGKATDLKAGAELAQQSLEEGAAKVALSRLIALTKGRQTP
jgi:anthranilate phosphoribosyltransferase